MDFNKFNKKLDVFEYQLTDKAISPSKLSILAASVTLLITLVATIYTYRKSAKYAICTLIAGIFVSYVVYLWLKF